MFSHRSDNARAGPTPLSDEQAKAQVVDLARQIAQLNNLPGLSAGFYFQSCNDQGEPPFQGMVEMSFQLPADQSAGSPAAGAASTYYKQIVNTMIAHGWNDGPPPGLQPYGTVIHKDRIMAIIQPGPNPGWNKIQLSGECRNMTDHRNDPAGFIDVTDQIKAK